MESGWGLFPMNLVKIPLQVGKVFKMKRLTSVMKHLNIGSFLFLSGLFSSNPGMTPILELKSPIAMTMNPWLRSLMASCVRRKKRSWFHERKESDLELWQAM